MAFNLSRFLPAIIFMAIVLTSGLTGCAPMVMTRDSASTDAPLSVDNNAVYLLNAGDEIKLVVYGEESTNANNLGTMTGTYKVDPNGMITIPMIGAVKAAGLSKDQLREQLTARLVNGGFMVQPLVTVDIESMRPFYIIGEVKTPGSYPWQPELDALKAIATAGGYTPRAAENKILVDRYVGTNGYVSKVRMNATEDTIILPGDSIIVRERIF